MINEFYLAIFLMLIIVVVIKYFAMKYRFEVNEYHFIQPEVFAEQWIEDSQKSDQDSIYYRLTNNLDDQKSIILQNLNNIKQSLQKDYSSLDIKDRKHISEMVVEQLRKVSIIIAVVQLKFQYEKDEQINILKSISNLIFQKQDVLLLVKNYVNKNKEQNELSQSMNQYREYILTQLSHYMYPY